MFLSRFLRIIKDKFDITEDSLRFIIENNIFIPDDRKDSVLKGLVAGFSWDFSTSMAILMPQVENSIRELAETCGSVVYKTEISGVEEFFRRKTRACHRKQANRTSSR